LIVEADTCGFRILLTVLTVSARCESKVQGQQEDHSISRLSKKKNGSCVSTDLCSQSIFSRMRWQHGDETFRSFVIQSGTQRNKKA